MIIHIIVLSGGYDFTNSSCHSSSDWLIVLDLAFVVIGQSVFFGFDLKTIS